MFMGEIAINQTLLGRVYIVWRHGQAKTRGHRAMHRKSSLPLQIANPSLWAFRFYPLPGWQAGNSLCLTKQAKKVVRNLVCEDTKSLTGNDKLH